MNNQITPHIWRFFLLVLVQGLVLMQMDRLVGSYFIVLLYPLFIFLLPMQTGTSILVLLGFAIGITVDLFYGTIGIHASAGAFGGFMRAFVFAIFEPKGGYSGKEPVFSPAHFGWPSFLQAAGLFMLLYLFWYFAVGEFTLYHMGSISLKTLAAWPLTMIFVVLYGFIFNPKA